MLRRGSAESAGHVVGLVHGRLQEARPAGVADGVHLAAHARELADEVEAKAMPDSVRERARKELRKLGQMNLMSAEATVVRNYLDWILALPWVEQGGHRVSIAEASAILADLGVSSLQFDRPERGFSLRADGPLDMRMDPTRGVSAADLLAGIEVQALTRILRDYGEEPDAFRIAKAVVAARHGGDVDISEHAGLASETPAVAHPMDLLA